MIIYRCRICKKEHDSELINRKARLEMYLCKECETKIKNGEIKIGRILTRRYRNRVLGKW